MCASRSELHLAIRVGGPPPWCLLHVTFLPLALRNRSHLLTFAVKPVHAALTVALPQMAAQAAPPGEASMPESNGEVQYLTEDWLPDDFQPMSFQKFIWQKITSAPLVAAGQYAASVGVTS